MGNMSKCLKDNLQFLRLLHETKSKSQKQGLLKSATPSQIRAFSEICLHILTGNCRLSNKDRKVLRKKIKSLKKIASSRNTYKQKKRHINQKGGGFLKLVPIILNNILPPLIKDLL